MRHSYGQDGKKSPSVSEALVRKRGGERERKAA